MEASRYRASLLKSKDLQTSPIFVSRQRTAAPATAEFTRSSPSVHNPGDSFVSLAKITTLPRCRDSVTSISHATPHSMRQALSKDHANAVVSPTHEDTKLTSFFQPISAGHGSAISHSDGDCRKNGSRLPLEVVHEMSELDVGNSHSNCTLLPSSSAEPVSHHHVHATPPSPALVTFESSPRHRRS